MSRDPMTPTPEPKPMKLDFRPKDNIPDGAWDRVRIFLQSHHDRLTTLEQSAAERGGKGGPGATSGDWHQVGDGAFTRPFGTVRACVDCDALVAGGPTRCRRCAEDASSSCPDGDAVEMLRKTCANWGNCEAKAELELVIAAIEAERANTGEHLVHMAEWKPRALEAEFALTAEQRAHELCRKQRNEAVANQNHNAGLGLEISEKLESAESTIADLRAQLEETNRLLAVSGNECQGLYLANAELQRANAETVTRYETSECKWRQVADEATVDSAALRTQLSKAKFLAHGILDGLSRDLLNPKDTIDGLREIIAATEPWPQGAFDQETLDVTWARKCDQARKERDEAIRESADLRTQLTTSESKCEAQEEIIAGLESDMAAAQFEWNSRWSASQSESADLREKLKRAEEEMATADKRNADLLRYNHDLGEQSLRLIAERDSERQRSADLEKELGAARNLAECSEQTIADLEAKLREADGLHRDASRSHSESYAVLSRQHSEQYALWQTDKTRLREAESAASQWSKCIGRVRDVLMNTGSGDDAVEAAMTLIDDFPGSLVTPASVSETGGEGLRAAVEKFVADVDYIADEKVSVRAMQNDIRHILAAHPDPAAEDPITCGRCGESVVMGLDATLNISGQKATVREWLDLRARIDRAAETLDAAFCMHGSMDHYDGSYVGEEVGKALRILRGLTQPSPADGASETHLWGAVKGTAK